MTSTTAKARNYQKLATAIHGFLSKFDQLSSTQEMPSPFRNPAETMTLTWVGSGKRKQHKAACEFAITLLESLAMQLNKMEVHNTPENQWRKSAPNSAAVMAQAVTLAERIGQLTHYKLSTLLSYQEANKQWLLAAGTIDRLVPMAESAMVRSELLTRKFDVLYNAERRDEAAEALLQARNELGSAIGADALAAVSAVVNRSAKMSFKPANSTPPHAPRRGDIYWMDNAEDGNDPRSSRPVLVLSFDWRNKAFGQVIVVPMRSKIGKSKDNIHVPAAVSGMPRDGEIVTHKVMSIPLERLRYHRAGVVPNPLVDQIAETCAGMFYREAAKNRTERRTHGGGNDGGRGRVYGDRRDHRSGSAS